MSMQSKHHRKPRSLGGSDDMKNISLVCRYKHEAWHRLFRNFPPEKIVAIINAVWLDPDYYLEVKKKEK